MNQKFLDALEKNQALLAKLVKFIRDYRDATGIAPDAQLSMELKVGNQDESKPKEFAPKEKTELKTQGLTNDELNAVYQGYATAIVKEKAIEFIKGFITGVMFK